MIWENVYQVIVLAFAGSTISLTITKSAMFESLRGWAGTKSELFGELMKCHYCMAHWVALFAFLIYRPFLIVKAGIVADSIVSILALVSLSSLIQASIVALIRSNNNKKEE